MPFALFALLSLADAVTTHAGIVVGIPEGNLLPGLSIGGGGLAAWGLFKAAHVGLVVAAMAWICRRRPWAIWGLHVGNVILTGAVVSNMAQVWG